MRFAVVIALTLGLAARAQTTPAPGFVQPDGHWWFGVGHDEGPGFVVGWSACDAGLLHHEEPTIMSRFESRNVVVDAITGHYRANPGSLGAPVLAVIAILENDWRAERAYPFVSTPAGAYSSRFWFDDLPWDLTGMIRGFVACQTAEQGADIRLPIAVLTQRVSDWYGFDPNHIKPMNPATVNDNLVQVILRAEQQPR